MATTTRKLANDKRRTTGSGTTYYVSWIVTDADYSAYDIAVGASAETITGIAGSTVNRLDKSKRGADGVGAIWRFDYECRSSDYTLVYGSTVNENPLRSFETKFIKFIPEWYGIRKCSKDDIETKPGLKNVYTDVANIGDWIYNNALADLVNKQGSPSFSACPFKSDTTDEKNIIKVNFLHEIPTSEYVVTYSTSDDVKEFETWYGVNPSSNAWGTGTALEPSTTTARAWKATGQKAEQYKATGIEKNRVTRKMLRAPTGLVWKLVENGGEWTW